MLVPVNPLWPNAVGGSAGPAEQSGVSARIHAIDLDVRQPGVRLPVNR